MTPGELAARGAFLLATSSALLLARPAALPTHRPVALLLGFAFVADLLRAVVPLVISRGLFLGFPLLSVALALEVFGHGSKASRRALAGAWGVLVVVVALAHPPRQDPGLARFFLAVHLGAIAAQVLAAIPKLARRAPITTSQTVALLLLAGDVGALLGGWLHGRPGRDWEITRWQWTVIYLVVCYVQVQRFRWIRAARLPRGSLRSVPPSRW